MDTAREQNVEPAAAYARKRLAGQGCQPWIIVLAANESYSSYWIKRERFANATNSSGAIAEWFWHFGCINGK
jgi:hypothetical protein